MRFTTWSTVTNVFIVSTVALLSLIPAANAFDILILSPAGGETYRPREKATVSWRIDKIDLVDVDSELSGKICDIVMMGSDNGYSYLLSKGVPILNDSALVKYPAAPPSTEDSGISYYISLQTEYGAFTSNLFFMEESKDAY
ncbi:hypothetical protein BJV77DRAFT_104164 [Russula vinacea]|nr:hypothetical protein BJV77DRAFT_104164 [Russula vinacea]